MLKVGLTGGIGSGKSTVATIFNILKVPVYCADERSKYLLNNSTELISSVLKLFGEKAYLQGKLNREFIATEVFTNKTKLKQLNEIAHPAVEKDFIEWCSNYLNTDYVIMEAAILFENEVYKQMDLNILIDAPEELRVQRVIKRDNISEQQVKERIKNQWATDKLRSFADIFINNDDKKLILPQILKIDTDLRNRWRNLVNG
jgi:dephospho-CoA kinase